MLGRGHISHYSEYVVSSTISIFSTLIDIVLRDYDAAFLITIVDFHFFYDGTVDIQIAIGHLSDSGDLKIKDNF